MSIEYYMIRYKMSYTMDNYTTILREGDEIRELIVVNASWGYPYEQLINSRINLCV
jgi:hypothetical protein